MSDNHYKNLGLEETATKDEIKKAFRSLSLKYHPDRNPNNQEAIDKFHQINNAYEILSDEQKKEEYDIKLNDLMVKIEEAKSLPLNSEFVQGTLEGPVKVTIGDNLYQKVGASEVVVLDGVIVEIRNSECDHTNIFSYN